MRKIFAIGVLVLVVGMLAACSGGSNAGTTINTTMTEFQFNPNEWTVPAGAEVTLNLKNEGAVEHDWVLMIKPVTPPAAQDSPDEVFSTNVPAGNEATVKFTAPATAGEYQVICTVPGHLEAGMTGTLIVTEK